LGRDLRGGRPRSFRTSKLADLIAFGGERAKLGARVVKDPRTRAPTKYHPGRRYSRVARWSLPPW
jgi:hypothetical protein